jgi:predicted lipoprotein with Yx(FWY)xxD motif
MNRRIGVLAAAAAIGLLALTGCSAGGAGGYRAVAPHPSASTQASAPVDLKTASTTLGTVVVDGKGLTVYVFDKDTADSGKSVCSGQCAAIWPAVITTSSSPRVDGVTGTVGTIPALSGGRQVTLDGLPLYTFSGDSSAGDVKGQGYMGIWWVVGADGVKMAPAPTAQKTSGTGSGMYSK